MKTNRAQDLQQLIASVTRTPVPVGALEAARMGILDCAGCIVGGASTPAAQKMLALATEQGGVAAAAVLGTNVRLPPTLAALCNGVAGHVLDYDDMSATFIGHPSVVLVPAILALAEQEQASGQRIIEAYVLGFEVDTWFGRIMIPHHYDAGWHATSSLGVFGAAAAASRLLRLDPDATLNALAIAASCAGGLRANFGSMTKSLHAGTAAEAGVRTALLSARGFTANAAVFDGPGGFFEAYGINSAPKAAPAGLEIEASGIGIKPYACCGAGVSVIDAALDARSAGGFAAADIASVDCIVSPMARRIMPYDGTEHGLQAKYCLAYCAAVALIDGKGGLAQFEDARVTRSDVQDLLRRVRVSTNPRMASGAGLFGIQLSVKLRDGSERRASLEVPRGHPQRQLDAEQLALKFVECAGPLVGADRAREAASLLERLESLPSIKPVIDLLVKVKQ
jgi:2-methylcitrate dehydratase PrpD